MELNLGLLITAIGMIIVFATLYALAEIIIIPKWIVSLYEKRKKKEPAPQPAIPAPNADIPPQHLAAIAAAIAALDQPYQIKVIEVLGNENWERSRYTDITSPY